MATITTIEAADNISDSRAVINTNLGNLNTDKIETSVLDTDGALTANSDAKIATQKAVKTYADTKTTNPMTTAGDIIYGGVSGVPTRLAKGTSGQVLKMNVGETAPEWGAVSGTGDVVAPATNTDSYIPQWDGTDSKTLKNGLSVADISQITNNADGFEVAGGTTSRKLKISGGDASIVGGGAATISFPTSTATLATLALSETLSNKTISGPLTLSENASIALDPAGSADGKYTGITVTGTAGDTLAFGDLITLDKDDSRWEKVDISAAAAATGDARGILGMCVLAGGDGDATKVLLNGIIRADSNFPTLTIGAAVYASTTGDVVVAQPTTTDYVIRIIGSALTADELYFNPGPVWTTHT